GRGAARDGRAHAGASTDKLIEFRIGVNGRDRRRGRGHLRRWGKLSERRRGQPGGTCVSARVQEAASGTVAGIGKCRSWFIVVARRTAEQCEFSEIVHG